MLQCNVTVYKLLTSIILLIAVLGLVSPCSALVAGKQGIGYIDLDKTYQKITGFGGSFAWWSDWLPQHEHKQEIYQLLFQDAGLNIIRLKNTYKYNNAFNPWSDLDIVQTAQVEADKRGEDVIVLMSSWSPASYLKSNNSISGKDGATLRKNHAGNYMYEEYGQYWYELIKAYRDYGIPIDYISIQNEGDWIVDYDGCIFSPSETPTVAGYDKAFNAVYRHIQALENPPEMLGPEGLTIDADSITRYLEPIIKENPDQLFGIAHHLYQGGEITNPDYGFKRNMNTLKERYPDLPKWMTEYYQGDALQTAWVIHNSLTEEDLNAYLYWDLVWELPGSFIGLENPYAKVDWKYDKGYIVHERYYALKHFSKFIRPGYDRVDASLSSSVGQGVKISAYAAPDKHEITVVMLNTNFTTEHISLDLNGYQVVESEVYLSDCRPMVKTEDGKYIVDKSRLFVKQAPLGSDNLVILPLYSIVTIVMSVE